MRPHIYIPEMFAGQVIPHGPGRVGSGRVGSTEPTRPARFWEPVDPTRPDPTREILKLPAPTCGLGPRVGF